MDPDLQKAQPFLSVMSRIGAKPDRHDPTAGSLEIRPQIVRAGCVRPAALMLLADVVVGMRLEAEFDDWTFTTDFSLRMVDTALTDGVVAVKAHELRHGRRLLVEQIDYTDAGGDLVAHAQITFMRTPMRDEDGPRPDIGKIRAAMADLENPGLDAPVVHVAGIEVIDAATGVTQLAPTEKVRRPGGFVQGAIMTMLGEESALALAEAHYGRPCVVTDLDVRYLIGGRTGPLVATPRWIGPPERNTIAVEVCDRGHGDIVTNTFLVRVEPN